MANNNKSKKRAYPVVNIEVCKGCERCVAACPKSCLVMGIKLNAMGYPVAEYTGEGCTGCGACFYNCPEPEAITIIVETDDESEEK